MTWSLGWHNDAMMAWMAWYPSINLGTAWYPESACTCGMRRTRGRAADWAAAAPPRTSWLRAPPRHGMGRGADEKECLDATLRKMIEQGNLYLFFCFCRGITMSHVVTLTQACVCPLYGG